MEKAEGLKYLTDAIKTPVGEIDESNPLCQERVITTGKDWETVKYKSVGKLDAFDKLAKILGWYAAEKHEVSVTSPIDRIRAQNAQAE